MLKKTSFLLYAALTVATLFLSACNTIEGVARDIRAVAGALTGESGPRGYYNQNKGGTP